MIWRVVTVDGLRFLGAGAAVVVSRFRLPVLGSGQLVQDLTVSFILL